MNGYPPPDRDYQELAGRHFAGYRLQVTGLVEEPLSLSLEDLRQLGFKMVKWIRSVEFVRDFHEVGLGHGGWREDYAMHSRVVGI